MRRWLFVLIAVCLAGVFAVALALPVAGSPPIPPLMDAKWPFRIEISRTLLDVGEQFTLTIDSFPISPVVCTLTVPSGMVIDQFPDLGGKGGTIKLTFPHEGRWVLTGRMTKPGTRDIWAEFSWATNSSLTTLHLVVVSKK